MKTSLLRILVLFLFFSFDSISFSQYGWISQHSSSGELCSIEFLNANTGICVGWYGKILKTTNAGLQWVQLPVFAGNNDFRCVKLIDSNIIILGSIGKIYRSTNFGQNWDSLNVHVNFNEIAYNSNTILMCGDSILMSSTNKGNSWSRQAFANYWSYGSMYFEGLCFSDNENCWLVSSETHFYPFSDYAGRVFHSSNRGSNWSISLTIDTGNISSMFEDICFADSLHGFIVGSGSIFETSNSGLNWNEISNINMFARKTYFLNSETGYIIGSDPTPPVGNAVIKYTTNHGLNWFSQLSIGGNIYTSTFYGINFINNYTGWICGYHDGIGSVIYGTTNGGLSAIQHISSEIPISPFLSQNYPNPFNPATKISFQIPPSKGDRGMTTTKLVVFDALGKEVATLVNQQLSPGTYQVDWDGTNYPSGVYFYQLTANDELISTKKMVLLK